MPRSLSALEREALTAFLPRSTRTNMDEVEHAVLPAAFLSSPVAWVTSRSIC